MIATKIDTVYEVELPPSIKEVLAAFSSIITFGFSSVGAVLECLGMRGYESMLALYILVPLAIAAFLLGSALLRLLCTSRCHSKELLQTVVPALLKLAFLAYPIVTNVAFDAFSCWTFADSEWLKADVSIQCGTAEHDGVKALAWVAICVYPIGLLLLNGALLFSCRRPIQTARHTALCRATAFLWIEYEPRWFFWE